MTTYGASTASSAAPRRAFRNISSQVVSFSAGQATYTLSPRESISLSSTDANGSPQLLLLLESGALQELTVYGAQTVEPLPVPVPTTNIVPAGISFTAATQSAITGNITGVVLSSDGHWILADGNRMLYANSKPRQQPTAGATSAITIGATMVRASVAGNFGFALYTDAAPTDTSFANGLIVLYEPTGLCNIYQVKNSLWTCITDRDGNGVFNQVPYPIDANEHTYATVVQQPDTDTLKISAFCDSQPVAVATITSGSFVTSGTVGFATTGGSSPIAIVPDSFEFTLGVDLRENLPIAAQSIIQVNSSGQPVLNVHPTGGAAGNLPQANHDPAIIAGSVTGSSKNLVPDSDLKFISALWNTAQAGALAVVSGVGLSGGNGIIVTVPVSGAIGQMRYISHSFATSPGTILSISGNIQAAATLTGGAPAWELWSLNTDGSVNTLIQAASQVVGTGSTTDGKARVVAQNITIPSGVTLIGMVASTNNATITAAGSLIFSEPQVETGPFATAYVANVFSDGGTIPFTGLPPSVTEVINLQGQLNVSSVQAGSSLPLGGNSLQVQTILLASQSGNTYLAGQTISNQNVLPNTVTGGQSKPTVYTNEVPNVYNNVSGNYNWYVPGTGPVDSTTTIANGSSLVYAVAIADPASSPAPAQELLKIAANSAITVSFTHPAYAASADGATRIVFTGSQQSAGVALAKSSALSGTSIPSITTVTGQNSGTSNQTATLTDTGNPQITSSIQQVTTAGLVTQAFTDTEHPAILAQSSGQSVPMAESLTIPSTASAPQVVGTTTITQVPTAKNSSVSNASSPTITSSTQNVTENVLQTATLNASGSAQIVPTYIPPGTATTQSSGAQSIASTATITSSSKTTYANTQQQSSLTAVSSSPSIVQTAKPPTYQITAHSSGTVTGSGSQATMSYIPSSQATMTGPGSSWTITDLSYSTIQCTDTPPIRCTKVNLGDTYSGGGSVNTSLPNSTEPPTATTPLSITVTVPTIGSNRSYTASLTRPDGTLYKTIAVDTGTNTYTISDNAETQVGAWKWTITAIPPTNTYHPSGGNDTSTSSTSTMQASSTLSYYTRNTTGNLGALETVATTPSSTVAPTSAATQLSFTISTVTKPSDSNGASGLIVNLYDPNQNLLKSWSDSIGNLNTITAGTVLTYFSSDATLTGSYTWKYETGVFTTTNSGLSNYTAGFTGTTTWYQNDAIPQGYTYSTTNGATSSAATSNVALASSSTTPIQLVLSNINLPSDSNGSTAFTVQLYDSNNSLVYNQNITTNQTITYNTASSAPIGTWTWKIFAIAVPNNPAAGHVYACSVDYVCEWYESVGTTVTTYTPNPGASVAIQTASTADAPTSSTPLTLALASVVTPTASGATSSFNVVLTDPNGATVKSWSSITTSQTLSCNAANGSAGTTVGVYTWTLMAQVTPVNTAGSYLCTAQATPTWYQTTTQPSYSYATVNGTAQTVTTGTALAPVNASTQLSLTISGISLTSNSYGSACFLVTLTGPNSIGQVGSWPVSNNTTITYSAPAMPAGAYIWTVTPVIATNTNTATSTQTLSASATMLAGWYVSQSVPVTTYTPHDGASTTYSTTSVTLPPTSAAAQLTLQITALTVPSNAAGSSAYRIILTEPDGVTQAGQWTGIVGTQSIAWSAPGAPAGIYTWTITGYCTTNNTATATYNDTLTGTLGWYENVPVQNTTYAASPGIATAFTTSSATLQPTSSATQLTLTATTLTALSDVNGVSSWTVTLTDASHTAVRTWTGLTSPQTLTWYGPKAIAGTYTWTVQAICTNTNQGSSTYSDTIAGSLGWYQAVVNSQTGYEITPGQPQSFQTPAAIVAPTTVGTQVSLVLSSVVAPSDANGTCSYVVTLLDPYSNQVGYWTGITAARTLSYSNTQAVAGVYTWTIYATVIESNTPGAESYTCSLSALAGWYTNQTAPLTVFTNNASTSIAIIETDASTAAPVSGATQLSFTPNSLTLPSNSNGTTNYHISLKNPSGVIVQSWIITTTAPLTYSAAGAPAGVWTWQAQANCTHTGNATTTFTTAINATVGWYDTQSSNTITATVHDGVASSYSTPGNTFAPTSAATELQLILNPIVTPSDSKGASSVSVVLYDPTNTAIAAGTQSGITAPVTITYYNAGATLVGSYTWVVYGQCTSNSTGSSTYGVSWSGQYSWYEPTPSTSEVYVLAADGVTKRLSCADNNVSVQFVSTSTVQFQITNSASVPLTFQLGAIASGF